MGLAERHPLRVALDADVVGADRIEVGGVDDGVGHRVEDVVAAGAVARLAADVPLGGGLGPDVVVHRMAAVAQRPGGPLHLVHGIVLHPPLGAGPGAVAPPLAVLHVPLGREDVEVVAAAGEVALLPLAAVGVGHLLRAEGDERMRRLEVPQHDVRALARIHQHVGHQRLPPAVVDLQVAVAAGGRAGVLVGEVRRVRRRRRFRAARGEHGQQDGQRPQRVTYESPGVAAPGRDRSSARPVYSCRA